MSGEERIDERTMQDMSFKKYLYLLKRILKQS